MGRWLMDGLVDLSKLLLLGIIAVAVIATFPWSIIALLAAGIIGSGKP